MKKYFLTISIIVFSFDNCCNAQTTAQKIDKLIQQYSAYGEFNGCVLVSQNNKVILKKGYGYANFEQKISNTIDTKFYIGSVTKTFTDLLVMQLVEKGKIRLDAKISEYLHDYPKPNGDSVTIYHLLTHTSGIPDDSDPRIDVDYYRHYSHNEMLALFDSLPLQFTPGSKWKYTNAGTYILGMILERLTGKAYSELLNENILIPLGMKNTGYTESKTPIKKFAFGYDLSGVNPVIKKNYDVTVAFSAWGMYSTIEDLQKWNEELYTEKLLSRKYLDIYFTPYKDNWACDWMILKNKPFYYANDSSIATYRGGNFGPFECFTVRYAKERHSIVLMGNCSYSRAEEIIKNITGILFNKPYTLPKQSLQKTFSEILDKKGLPNASDDILNKAKDTNTYYISASEFLHLGYAYKYEKKDLKAAIQVFELMAKLFPTTYNAYDSEYFSDRSNVYGILGSCYLEDGQKEKAIVNFKKAITLNPDDTNAIELIKKLEKE